MSKSVKEIRKINIKLLAKKAGSQKKLSDATGIDAGYISQMSTGSRGIGDKTARKLEDKLKLSAGWMDSELDTVDRSKFSKEDILYLEVISSLPDDKKREIYQLIDSESAVIEIQKKFD